MRRVILGCDTHLDYAFYLPIASLFWRVRGWRPTLLLVGDPKRWINGNAHLRIAVDRSREAGAEVHWLGEDWGDVRTSTVAQCSRVFAHEVPGVSDDDLLMTSDVDMLPINAWAGSGIEGRDRVHVYFANAYAGSDYEHYPMCYIAAEAWLWRDITSPATLRTMLAEAPFDRDGAWNWDERWLGGAIARLRASSSDVVRLVDRNFIEGEWRVDRSDWDGAMSEVAKRGSLRGVADAHVIRPGHDDANWSRLRPLLSLALRPEHLAWVDGYREAWREAWRGAWRDMSPAFVARRSV